jgi:hypothetical protein
MDAVVRTWNTRARAFEAEAHRLFSKHEGSSSRIIELRHLSKKLLGLPIDVNSYFGEAVECLERGLVRSATVMAWAGFFSVFIDALYGKHEADIRTVRNKWTFADISELKESQSESALLKIAKEVGFIKQHELRKYDGQLSTRNQCAHPTLYKPSANEAIGFVDLMIGQTIRHM